MHRAIESETQHELDPLRSFLIVHVDTKLRWGFARATVKLGQFRSNRREHDSAAREKTYMKNFRPLISLLTLICAFALTACKTTDSAKSTSKNVIFVCACGADCKCTSVSTKPGKCGCGHELKAAHLCKVEGDVALLCVCAPDCKCTIDAANPTQCGCGKPLRKVGLKGTGIYFCNCGGSCSCNTVSATPATCKCGMALKKVD